MEAEVAEACGKLQQLESQYEELQRRMEETEETNRRLLEEQTRLTLRREQSNLGEKPEGKRLVVGVEASSSGSSALSALDLSGIPPSIATPFLLQRSRDSWTIESPSAVSLSALSAYTANSPCTTAVFSPFTATPLPSQDHYASNNDSQPQQGQEQQQEERERGKEHQQQEQDHLVSDDSLQAPLKEQSVESEAADPCGNDKYDGHVQQLSGEEHDLREARCGRENVSKSWFHSGRQGLSRRQLQQLLSEKEEEIRAYKNRAEQLAQKLSRLDDRNSRLRSSESHARVEAAKLAANLFALSSQNEELEEALEHLRRRNEELESAVVRLQSDTG